MSPWDWNTASFIPNLLLSQDLVLIMSLFYFRKHTQFVFTDQLPDQQNKTKETLANLISLGNHCGRCLSHLNKVIEIKSCSQLLFPGPSWYDSMKVSAVIYLSFFWVVWETSGHPGSLTQKSIQYCATSAFVVGLKTGSTREKSSPNNRVEKEGQAYPICFSQRPRRWKEVRVVRQFYFIKILHAVLYAIHPGNSDPSPSYVKIVSHWQKLNFLGVPTVCVNMIDLSYSLSEPAHISFTDSFVIFFSLANKKERLLMHCLKK